MLVTVLLPSSRAASLVNSSFRRRRCLCSPARARGRRTRRCSLGSRFYPRLTPSRRNVEHRFLQFRGRRLDVLGGGESGGGGRERRRRRFTNSLAASERRPPRRRVRGGRGPASRRRGCFTRHRRRRRRRRGARAPSGASTRRARRGTRERDVHERDRARHVATDGSASFAPRTDKSDFGHPQLPNHFI